MKRINNQSGTSLIEVLIALVIVSVLAVVVLDALSTSSRTMAMTDERVLAKNLAETQMEHVKQLSFSPGYVALASPGGYASTINVQPINDGNIQKITVAITRHGDTVFMLEDYKIRE